MKKIPLLFAGFLLFSACNPSVQKEENLILVSIPPLTQAVKAVAGADFKVYSFVSSGQSAHEFSPLPEDLARLEKASLYFELGIEGLESEDLMRILIQKNRPDLFIEKAASSLTLLPSQGQCSHHDKNHEHDHAHQKNKSFDPHVWLSVKMMMQMTPTIQAALAARYPEKAGVFESNARAYLKSLQTLDEEIALLLKDLRGAAFMEFHPAWAYFAKDYGLETAGAVQVHGGHEQTSGLYEIREFMEKAKKSGARAVTVEPNFNRELALQAAAEFQITLVVLDTLEGINENQTYFEVMRANAENLAAALTQKTAVKP